MLQTLLQQIVPSQARSEDCIVFYSSYIIHSSTPSIGLKDQAKINVWVFAQQMQMPSNRLLSCCFLGTLNPISEQYMFSQQQSSQEISEAPAVHTSKLFKLSLNRTNTTNKAQNLAHPTYDPQKKIATKPIAAIPITVPTSQRGIRPVVPVFDINFFSFQLFFLN
eukprot:TRINITY_DN456_c0_g3_i2.p3 TRINITY_DN456_c0_g3~~TRINITY_DN456_c0_g3_i2.p3  ORF type:complete len:165 (+),score=4.00 TRINITY_DN456_c0_g3_i2:136-630(+)